MCREVAGMVARTGRVQTIRSALAHVCERFAMRAAGLGRPTVGIALGSGAARGLAHIGVLEVLEENAVPVDMVAGCSMGAVVGGCYAAGMSPREIREVALSIDKREMLKYTDPGVARRSGLINGRRIQELVRELTQDKTFDQLLLPFACTAADIGTGEEVPMDEGAVHEAIRASISIPGVFVPVTRGERVLVDGAIVNPVPVDYIVAARADIAIAVDVIPSASRHDLRKNPSTLSILVNAFDIMGRLVATPIEEMATVVIRPDVGDFTGLEFWRARTIIEEGRKAAELAMPSIKSAFDRLLS
jgi:NTE family protein